MSRKVNPYLRVKAFLASIMHLGLCIYFFNLSSRPNVVSDQYLYGLIPPRGWSLILGLACLGFIVGLVWDERAIRIGFVAASAFWGAITAVYIAVAIITGSQGTWLGILLVGYISSLHILGSIMPTYVSRPSNELPQPPTSGVSPGESR